MEIHNIARYNMTMDQSDNQTQINTLKDEVVRLEARLEELAADYRKAVRALAGYDELLNKHCHLLDKELADAFGRIKNVELRIFPNLARDMTHLYDIMGDGEDKADNPLD